MKREPYYKQALRGVVDAHEQTVIHLALENSGLFQRVEELEALVEECKRNHQEPFACSRTAEGGYVCDAETALEAVLGSLGDLGQVVQDTLELGTGILKREPSGKVVRVHPRKVIFVTADEP